MNILAEFMLYEKKFCPECGKTDLLLLSTFSHLSVFFVVVVVVVLLPDILAAKTHLFKELDISKLRPCCLNHQKGGNNTSLVL